MKREVEITIFGSKYTLEGNKEYIERLADYVEQRIKEGLKNSPEVSSLKVVVTTLLSMADELFTLKERMMKERRGSEFTEEKVNGLIRLIDEKIEQLRHFSS
ncbi:MAG: cell division protein ZapA [Candidatus Omnitrophica bacterium]|nr:cell division protein ZapA [Candidatus Omnitrophota bacterium]